MTRSLRSGQQLPTKSLRVYRSVWHMTAVVAVGHFVVGCGGPGSSSPYYCAAQKRSLSDEEFIEIAIREQVNANRMDIDGSESSIRNFIKEHPTCCSIERNGEDPSFINKVTGFRAVDVQIVFPVKEDLRKTIGANYEGHVVIRPCGEVDREYGSSTEG